MLVKRGQLRKSPTSGENAVLEGKGWRDKSSELRTLLGRVALLVGQREEAQRRLRGTVVRGKRKTGKVPGFEGQSRSVSERRA